MNILDEINDITSGFTSGITAGRSTSAAGFIGFVTVALVITFLVATYIFNCLQHMNAGRKTGRTEDWMAFVPFARSVYRLRMMDQQWWKMFFLGETAFYSLALFWLLSMINDVFASVVVTLFLLCCLAYNVYYRRIYFQSFGLSKTLALLPLTLIGVGVIEILDILIAFTQNYTFHGVDAPAYIPGVSKEQSAGRIGGAPPARGAQAGSITGLTGMYAGQDIPIAPGEETIIGRDSAVSNIIVTQNADKVSRRHCGILFDAAQNMYTVTDYSSNGTFIDGGSRLVANMPTTLSRGTVIALGNRENRFKLN